MANVNHAQPSDPAKLGQAIVELAQTDNPPLHFPVGGDATTFVENNHAEMKVEFDQWRSLSSATSFDA